MWIEALSSSLPWDVASLRVRALLPDDADLFAQTQYGPKADKAAIRKAIIVSRGSIPGLYVAERANERHSIGVCGYIKNTELGIIDLSIKLLPEYRCKGYGRILLAELRDRWFSLPNQDSLYATVDANNEKAKSILAVCGFSHLRSFTGSFREQKELYCYEKVEPST